MANNGMTKEEWDAWVREQANAQADDSRGGGDMVADLSQFWNKNIGDPLKNLGSRVGQGVGQAARTAGVGILNTSLKAGATAGDWLEGLSGSVNDVLVDPSSASNTTSETSTTADKQEDPFKEAYVRKNDPTEIGNKAYERSLSRMLAENQNRRLRTGETYSDLYQQARQMAIRNSALSNTSGFTGGMAEQAQGRISAAQMAQLGNIGASREQAMRQLDVDATAFESNALLEAQQAKDYARQDMYAEFERMNQIQSILSQVEDVKDLSPQQLEMLKILGYVPEKGDGTYKRTGFLERTFKPKQTLQNDPEAYYDWIYNLADWFQKQPKGTSLDRVKNS